MLGLTGQLGIGGLGNFELATILSGQAFIPHRGVARSALASPVAGSALSAARAASSLASPGARSAAASPGARSTISAQTPESEVDDG